MMTGTIQSSAGSLPAIKWPISRTAAMLRRIAANQRSSQSSRQVITPRSYVVWTARPELLSSKYTIWINTLSTTSLADEPESPSHMETRTRTTSYIVHSIAAALLLTAQISQAGSATWLSSPQDSVWENPNNWTAGGPPNGPSDVATFAQSSHTDVNVSTSEEVNSIVFTSSAASFTLSVS